METEARLNWVTLGDRNTCFFHMSARLHNNKNHIQKVMQKEICLKTPNGIKDRAFNFFS